MIYYKVKPEYDQTYKNPRIHNANILVKNAHYTDTERKKMLIVPGVIYAFEDYRKRTTQARKRLRALLLTQRMI